MKGRVMLEDNLAKRSDMHYARKLWHFGWGAFAIGLCLFNILSTQILGLICLGVATLGFASDFFRFNHKEYNKRVLKKMGFLMRKSEVDGFSGLPFYALGMGFSLLLFKAEIAILSIMYLVISDPLASIVGIKWGSKKILPNKSWIGFLAAFFSAMTITYFSLYSSNIGIKEILFGFLAGLIAAFSELTSAFNVDDNLLIPVLSGFGLTLINLYFQII